MLFHGMHALGNVVREHALQFADKASEYLHFGNGHEFCFLQCADMAGDRGEVFIELGRAVVRLQLMPEMFSLKMLSSQVASYVGDLVRAACDLKATSMIV